MGKAIRIMRNHKLLSSVFSNDDVTIKATLLIVKVCTRSTYCSVGLDLSIERSATDNHDYVGEI